MERLQFKTAIHAAPEKVWDVLWNDATYRIWTAVFSEGSRAETDWKKGSKVLFLDATGCGMVSRIADLVPDAFMSFEHLGTVKKGVEDTESEENKQWAGAHENYTLRKNGDQTEVTVDIDITEAYKDYFLKAFAQALDEVKRLSEKG